MPVSSNQVQQMIAAQIQAQQHSQTLAMRPGGPMGGGAGLGAGPMAPGFGMRSPQAAGGGYGYGPGIQTPHGGGPFAGTDLVGARFGAGLAQSGSGALHTGLGVAGLMGAFRMLPMPAITSFLDPFSGTLSAGSAGKALGGWGGAGLAGGAMALGYMGVGMALNAATDSVVQGAREQVFMKSQLALNANRQTLPGMGGMSGQQGLDATKMIRGMANQDPMTNVSELTGLLTQGMQSGAFRNVAGMGQLKTKFKEIVAQTKEVAETFGTFLQDAQQIIGQFQSMGYWNSGQAAGMARHSGLMDRGMALGSGTFSGIMRQGSQMARSVGLRGATGANMSLNIASQIGAAERAGVLSASEMMEMTGAGNIEGALAAMSGGYAQAAYRVGGSRIGSTLITALMDPETGHIDPHKAAMFKAGGYDRTELRKMYRGNRKKRGVRTALKANRTSLTGELIDSVGMQGALYGFAQAELGRRGLKTGESADDVIDILLNKYGGLGERQSEVLRSLVRAQPAIEQEITQKLGEQVREIDRQAWSQKHGSIEAIKRKLVDKYVSSWTQPLKQWGAGIADSGSRMMTNLGHWLVGDEAPSQGYSMNLGGASPLSWQMAGEALNPHSTMNFGFGGGGAPMGAGDWAAAGPSGRLLASTKSQVSPWSGRSLSGASFMYGGREMNLVPERVGGPVGGMMSGFGLQARGPDYFNAFNATMYGAGAFRTAGNAVALTGRAMRHSAARSIGQAASHGAAQVSTGARAALARSAAVTNAGYMLRGGALTRAPWALAKSGVTGFGGRAGAAWAGRKGVLGGVGGVLKAGAGAAARMGVGAAGVIVGGGLRVLPYVGQAYMIGEAGYHGIPYLARRSGAAATYDVPDDAALSKTAGRLLRAGFGASFLESDLEGLRRARGGSRMAIELEGSSWYSNKGAILTQAAWANQVADMLHSAEGGAEEVIATHLGSQKAASSLLSEIKGLGSEALRREFPYRWSGEWEGRWSQTKAGLDDVIGSRLSGANSARLRNLLKTEGGAAAVLAKLSKFPFYEEFGKRGFGAAAEGLTMMYGDGAITDIDEARDKNWEAEVLRIAGDVDPDLVATWSRRDYLDPGRWAGEEVGMAGMMNPMVALPAFLGGAEEKTEWTKKAGSNFGQIMNEDSDLHPGYADTGGLPGARGTVLGSRDAVAAIMGQDTKFFGADVTKAIQGAFGARSEFSGGKFTSRTDRHRLQKALRGELAASEAGTRQHEALGSFLHLMESSGYDSFGRILQSKARRLAGPETQKAIENYRRPFRAASERISGMQGRNYHLFGGRTDVANEFQVAASGFHKAMPDLAMARARLMHSGDAGRAAAESEVARLEKKAQPLVGDAIGAFLKVKNKERSAILHAYNLDPTLGTKLVASMTMDTVMDRLIKRGRAGGRDGQFRVMDALLQQMDSGGLYGESDLRGRMKEELRENDGVMSASLQRELAGIVGQSATGAFALPKDHVGLISSVHEMARRVTSAKGAKAKMEASDAEIKGIAESAQSPKVLAAIARRSRGGGGNIQQQMEAFTEMMPGVVEALGKLKTALKPLVDP